MDGKRVWLVGMVAFAFACGLERDPKPPVIHARFDPDAKVIPMPTDVLRDDVAGKLDVPVDDEDLTDAEREFYAFLNTLDGWSTTMPATVEFTAPIDGATIDGATLQVWEFDSIGRRVEDVTASVDQTGIKITIDAPREGWKRGSQYVVLLRGGEQGVKGLEGERVECDAAFYFLRLTEKLDTPEHERAFPGDTRAERQDNARKLEELRLELAPYFDWFEQSGLPRNEVAALWRFTITTRVELAMDKASQRMPIPFDILLDPDTGRVDLPPAAWDSPTVVEAKRKLAEYDGFGTSTDILFQFTGPVDTSTVTPDTVKLWDISGAAPRHIPSTLRMLDDRLTVVFTPGEMPLAEQSRYAVTVSDDLLDADGVPVIPMAIGHFMRTVAPIAVDGASQIGAVDDADAARVEGVRTELAPLFDSIGREGLLTAFPFTTMSIREHLLDLQARAATLNIPPTPLDVEYTSPSAASADFPLGLILNNVKAVYNGTIPSPVYLDPITRGFRDDGRFEIENVGFTMAIPDVPDDGRPLPVVIFGHGIMTERRFVLAIANELGRRGFASISIDMPYHGTRTHCAWNGPLCWPDTISGEEICPDPCQSGATCQADGRCVDENGEGNYLAEWPIINYPQASGAAFIEVAHISNTRDHFRQSVIDLGALSRSLRTANWEPLIGHPIRTDELYYTGQSLGGIIGATYVALDPAIRRAVLNVPGADTVDLFSNSPVFSGHVDLFLQQEEIEQGSYDEEKFMNVARWFMDATDPINQAPFLAEGRDVMIQMATLDFVITNPYTLALEDAAGVPRRDYIAEHAFIVVPVEPEFLRGQLELAGYLEGTFEP